MRQADALAGNQYPTLAGREAGGRGRPLID